MCGLEAGKLGTPPPASRVRSAEGKEGQDRQEVGLMVTTNMHHQDSHPTLAWDTQLEFERRVCFGDNQVELFEAVSIPLPDGTNGEEPGGTEPSCTVTGLQAEDDRACDAKGSLA